MRQSSTDEHAEARQTVLFMQGPISPFFAELGAAMERNGHRVLRVNVNLGDWLFWHRYANGAGKVFDYRGRTADWPSYIKGLMQRHQVTDLILLGEQRYYQRVAIEAAKSLGIAVSVTDFGYLRPDWITLERDGMSGDSRLPREPSAIYALARQSPPADLSHRYDDSFALQALWDVIYHIVVLLGRPLYPFYRTYHINHPLLNYLGTGWRMLRQGVHTRQANAVIDALASAPASYWVVPMQMEVDFSIRAYSPYPDMWTPLREIIDSFAGHAPEQDRLVIKLHPLDPGLRRWSQLIRKYAADAGVADRVSFIDGGSLDHLLQRAKGVVTVNSTVGIWALRAGLPVKTLGSAVYNIDGLVYGGTLHRFWQEAQRPDADLTQAFVRAIADTIQLRGVYYGKQGRMAGVAATMKRLLVTYREAMDERLANAAASEPTSRQGAAP
jgi:capsular polysaccharide export protein